MVITPSDLSKNSCFTNVLISRTQGITRHDSLSFQDEISRLRRGAISQGPKTNATNSKHKICQRRPQIHCGPYFNGYIYIYICGLGGLERPREATGETHNLVSCLLLVAVYYCLLSPIGPDGTGSGGHGRSREAKGGHWDSSL